MSLQLLENKALSWGIIGKSAPILAEITIRKSQKIASRVPLLCRNTLLLVSDTPALDVGRSARCSAQRTVLNCWVAFFWIHAFDRSLRVYGAPYLRVAVSSADRLCRNERPFPRDTSVKYTQYTPVSCFTTVTEAQKTVRALGADKFTLGNWTKPLSRQFLACQVFLL